MCAAVVRARPELESERIGVVEVGDLLVVVRREGGRLERRDGGWVSERAGDGTVLLEQSGDGDASAPLSLVAGGAGRTQLVQAVTPVGIAAHLEACVPAATALASPMAIGEAVGRGLTGPNFDLGENLRRGDARAVDQTDGLRSCSLQAPLLCRSLSKSEGRACGNDPAGCVSGRPGGAGDGADYGRAGRRLRRGASRATLSACNIVLCCKSHTRFCTE